MSIQRFNMIAAIDAKNGIGKKGGIPWKLSSDMEHFKEITTRTQSKFKSNAVIMGRKTWESIPEKFRPLPERINIVLTRNDQIAFPASVVKASNLDEAFEYVSMHLDEIEEIFVIGGQQVYGEAIRRPECKFLYLTQIFKAFECDAFFPSFEESFNRIESSDYLEENMVTFHYSIYERK